MDIFKLFIMSIGGVEVARFECRCGIAIQDKVFADSTLEKKTFVKLDGAAVAYVRHIERCPKFSFYI